MPISKASLGVQGEHLLADNNGMIPTPGDSYADLAFGVDPWAPESPIIYDNWEHYLAVCFTAQDRAANAAKLAAEV
jgi:hypothetical protein